MNRLKNCFTEKSGIYFKGVAVSLKFIGMMEILFAIAIGAKYALSNNVDLTVAMISGFLFLIGISTAYTGLLFYAFLTERIKLEKENSG